jgi:hypothetical protein
MSVMLLCGLGACTKSTHTPVDGSVAADSMSPTDARSPLPDAQLLGRDAGVDGGVVRNAAGCKLVGVPTHCGTLPCTWSGVARHACPAPAEWPNVLRCGAYDAQVTSAYGGEGGGQYHDDVILYDRATGRPVGSAVYEYVGVLGKPQPRSVLPDSCAAFGPNSSFSPPSTCEPAPCLSDGGVDDAGHDAG